MAYEFYDTLQFQSGFISGMLAGKPLNCLVNPSVPGSAPAKGLYQIQAPVNDVVFGPTAVMTLVGRSDGGGATFASLECTGGGAFRAFDKLPAGVDGSFVGVKQSVGNSASLFDKLVPGSSGSSYVLSSIPIPGRNCLVVQSYFADLMEALQKAGGAVVKF